MFEKRPLLLFVSLLILTLAGTAAAYVNIDVIDRIGSYFPGQNITGQVNITFSEYFDRDSILRVCTDTCTSSSPFITLHDYLYGQNDYSYASQSMSYHITSDGYNNWTEHPQQSFSYNLSANGTCGACGEGTCGGENCGANCQCGQETAACIPINPPNVYPCIWDRFAVYNGVVNSSEGLKLVRQSPITPPLDNNGDTSWYVDVITNKDNVKGTMRAACGLEVYENSPVTKSGWVRRKGTAYILCSQEECLNPSNTNCKGDVCVTTWNSDGAARWKCIEKFDNASLRKTGNNMFRAYGGPSQSDFEIYTSDVKFGGGIYKGFRNLSTGAITWEYLQYNSSTGTEWSGSGVAHDCGGNGYVRINSWDSSAFYAIVYLPPSGDRTCAYTNATTNSSQSWNNYDPGPSRNCDRCAAYTRPNMTTLAETQLSYLLKNCPYGVAQEDCTKTATFYESYSTNSNFTVLAAYRSGVKELDVTITAKLALLVSENRTWVNFSKFYNLKAPLTTGSHNLLVSIIDPLGKPVKNVTYSFSVGSDIDADGLTVEQGDCNDTNRNVHPGAPEICDGLDNDCNGGADEPYQNVSAGKITGRSCYNWSKSACAGTWVCSQNGLELVCSSSLAPGDQQEICFNDKDDDCDGEVDETEELVDDKVVMACTFKCTSGQSTDCGSNIGECRKGYRVCVNSQWSECIDNVGPKTEVCDGKDNDCSGVIDDIDDKDSINSTHCACYGGALPSLYESCNDIDDNCNNKIDDGVKCCDTGQVRECGSNMGICTYGSQTCTNKGGWGVCEGGIQPQVEICYDSLDNNCNGKTDDLCDTKVTCFNKMKDLNEMATDCGGPCAKQCTDYTMWILFTVVVVAIIISAGILEFTGRL
jgi:hypothetical protein